MDMNEIFENGCFSPGWVEKDEAPRVVPHKGLDTLLAELEEIKNKIEDVQAKQWYLARLVQYHEEGFSET